MSEYGTTEYGTTPKTELPWVPISDTNLCLKSELCQFGSLAQTVLAFQGHKNYFFSYKMVQTSSDFRQLGISYSSDFRQFHSQTVSRHGTKPYCMKSELQSGAEIRTFSLGNRTKFSLDFRRLGLNRTNQFQTGLEPV